jgi:hypothetical protein
MHTHPPTSAHARVRPTLALLALAAAFLAGCSTTTVAGRVVPGPIGRSLVLPAEDDRFLSAGLSDVRVEILQDASGSLIRVAEATTAAEGDFTVRLPNDKLRKGPISVRASADAVFLSTTRVNLPTPGQRVLVQVVQRPDGAAP